jgi:hypothetical protein
MEVYSTEIYSPLTEDSPPVPSSTLDSCPLILENNPSLEHLEQEETKKLGSGTEILPIPSEISSPCALIGEDCSPAVSVTLEFFPLISQNCEELEPLDNEEQENPGPGISTCEEIIPTEETLPVEDIPESLGNLLPANLEEKFGEEETEEICSNNFNPVDGSALQIVILDQLPTINSEVLITGKTEAPDSASSEIPKFGSPEICTQKNSPSLESLKIELILADGKEKSHMVPEINIIGQQIEFPFPVTPESSTNTLKVIFQKDPGKTIRNFINSAFVSNPQPEVLAAFSTHQKTLLHQYIFQTFKTPDISPSFIKPPTATPENIGKGKPAKLRNKRFNTISLKQTSSMCSECHSLEFRKNTLHFMSFLVKVKGMRHPGFQFLQTPLKLRKYNLNSIWRPVRKINPVVCLINWNISVKNRSKAAKEVKNIGFQLFPVFEQSESTLSPGPFGIQTQIIDIEATTFPLLLLNSLDQNFKKKKQKRWIIFKIILPFGTAECTPLIRLLIKKKWSIEARATGVDLLQSNHWAQNTINKRYWMLMVVATSFASRALFFLVQKVGKEEKEDPSGQLLWIWQTGRNNNQSNSRNYRLGLLEEDKRSISSEYVPSGCVFIKSQGARPLEASGFLMFQLEHSTRGGINRNYKVVAVRPTSLALWTLNSKQTKHSISQNITGHSRDTIVLDPLKKRRLTDHWKRSTVTRESSSPEIVVQVGLYNDYGYGSGEIEDSLFSSCSDTFDVICQASCMGRPRATGAMNHLKEEATKATTRKVLFCKKRRKRRTTNDLSELPTVQLGTQETGHPSIKIGYSFHLQSEKRRTNNKQSVSRSDYHQGQVKKETKKSIIFGSSDENGPNLVVLDHSLQDMDGRCRDVDTDAISLALLEVNCLVGKVILKSIKEPPSHLPWIELTVERGEQDEKQTIGPVNTTYRYQLARC